ncbi:MAG TPA: 4a-hydroxytetrahydrobiopterin dehydratase [Longimicrobiales bacterium]|nr:4a-hydroxytetrahydrobiopterin dehydratase [Longimicrobiales bacterium]
MSERLAPDEIEKRLAALRGWSVREGRLHRELQFPTFAAAFGFMTSVAIEAQALDHHPDWSNSYTRVTIELVSHDVQGLTGRDFRLAAKIDGLLAGAGTGGEGG